MPGRLELLQWTAVHSDEQPQFVDVRQFRGLELFDDFQFKIHWTFQLVVIRTKIDIPLIPRLIANIPAVATIVETYS